MPLSFPQGGTYHRIERGNNTSLLFFVFLSLTKRQGYRQDKMDLRLFEKSFFKETKRKACAITLIFPFQIEKYTESEHLFNKN